MFSRDAQHLSTVTADSVVRAHPFDTDKLKAIARDRVTRSLTTEDCRAYLPGLPCP